MISFIETNQFLTCESSDIVSYQFGGEFSLSNLSFSGEQEKSIKPDDFNKNHWKDSVSISQHP